MKDRNQIAIKTIRNLIAALDNAGAVQIEMPKEMPMSGGIAGATDGLGSTEVQRKELTGEDFEVIIRREILELTQAMKAMKNHPGYESMQYSEQQKILEKYLL